MITIRKESSADISAIHQVTIDAFANAPFTGHTEQFIVKRLRETNALSISLVAEHDGVVVGHVAVSPVTISDGSKNWFGLGPISVVSAQQNNGIGSALMTAAIDELKTIKASGCVLLGEPAFYNRFGFVARPELTLPDVPAEYFLTLCLGEQLPQGEVTYHEAFLATE